MIYFFFVINKAIIQENNTDVPTYNRLILKEVGIRPEPIELYFFVGNYTTFKISLKIINQIENNKIINNNLLLLSQILNSNAPVNVNDNINVYYTEYNNSNSKNKKAGLIEKKETTKTYNDRISYHVSDKISNKSNNNNELNPYMKEEDCLSFDFKYWKKFSVPAIEEHVKSELEVSIEKENNNLYFLKGIHYDTYLIKLKSEKRKEFEYVRETFCKGFFIASFPQKNGQVIENSQSFPAPCGHKECSSLPSMQPEIISRYPLLDTKTFELNNLAATICFPTGIKVCYSEENPPLLNDYVTPITTQKGERCYMVTYHFYYKISNVIYSKLYEMHPLKHHLMKFADSYLNLTEKEMKKNIMNKIQKSLAKSQELGFRDYVYIPYCICLISRYPYVNEMKKCLQSIYTMIVNKLKYNNRDLNNLIMHLIHSVPIPERETGIKFFIPYFNKNIKLICPKMQDINIINTNLSNLLQYFSIDYIVIILRLILFEKKVLFIDNDYTRLSLVIDNFLSLIYPFNWPHTYIPIMSHQMLQMLLSFIPYLNGIHSSFIPLVQKIFQENEIEDEEELYMVYISQSKFQLGSTLINKNKKKYKYLQEHVPALPIHLEKELKNKLKKIKDELDSYLKINQKIKNLDLNEFDLRIRNSFIEMFVDMFHDYYKYMTFLDDDVVFNKSLFLEKITSIIDKKFYSEFLDTQIFQQFCQNIVNDELNYFTTMTMNYNPFKNISLTSENNLSFSVLSTYKRSLTNIVKREKIYVIKPEYLKIEDENMENIEKIMEKKYRLEEKVDEEGMVISKERILTDLGQIKDENYKYSNCYIYTIPESQKLKKGNTIDNSNSKGFSKKNIIIKALQSMKYKKSSKNLELKDEYGITQKEKEFIKETIKDFTMKIFTSIDIKEDQNLKKELQKSLNTSFGREFFVDILSKNVSNIILLKDKSFQLFGTLIYNTLLFILNIKETDNILGQMVILIKSTKYYGKEVNGKTITLWNEYKYKIQGYSKVNQNNFWEKWYNIESIKNKLKKEDAILKICNIMIELELDKSFIKITLQGIAEKAFGKDSEGNKDINELILDKLLKSKYIFSKTTII